MTQDLGYPARRELADFLRTRRQAVAEQVTEAFLRKHPSWLEKSGRAARIRGVEDAGFHIDFLAGAIESGSAEAFGHYVRWTAGVLEARGISRESLVENLEQVAHHLAEGLAHPEREMLASYVLDACTALADYPEVSGPYPEERAVEWGVYLQAILGGHREAALNVALDFLERGDSVADVYCDVLQPAQYEIGRMWERNRITVAREHMATAITQYVVANLYTRLEVPEKRRGTGVMTGVEGELHQLGSNMMADVLEASGWSVRFLGTQMPHAGILQAVEEHEASFVGISATMLFSLPKVSRLIEKLRGRIGDDLRIVVGGAAFRSRPEIWREIGADGFGRDLRDGVAVVEKMFDQPAPSSAG